MGKEAIIDHLLRSVSQLWRGMSFPTNRNQHHLTASSMNNVPLVEHLPNDLSFAHDVAWRRNHDLKDFVRVRHLDPRKFRHVKIGA